MFCILQIESGGAERTAELLTHKKHKSQLHSLNMSDNNISEFYCNYKSIASSILQNVVHG